MGECIALSRLKFRTQEGPAYLVVAVDAFSGFAYQLGGDTSDDPALVVKAVYELTEHPYFTDHFNQEKGFALVLEEFEEQEERISKVIKGMKGKVIYNSALNNTILQSLLESLAENMFKHRE